MEDAFHVPAVAKSDRYAVPFAAVLFVAVTAANLIWTPWLGVLGLPLPAAFLWQVWRLRRLARQGVVFDADGVGPAEDGEQLWTLAWRDYGGFRFSTASFWERVRYPERAGYEILGRDGQPLFHYLHPGGGASTAHLTVAARQELRRRLPDGAADPHAAVSRPPKASFVAKTLALAAVGGGLAWGGLRNPLSPLLPMGLIGAFVGLGALVAAGFETASLVRWARGWRPTPSLPPLPEEGPALSRHLARHERRPITLEEGGRYRTVDPDRTRRRLENMVHLCTILFVLCGVASFGIVLGLIRQFAPAGLLPFAFFGGFSSVCLKAIRTHRDRLAANDDALWVHEGSLIVVRANGEILSLSLPGTPDRLALWRRDWWGHTDAWRLPDGTRYAIDRTRLYAAPTPDEED